MSNSIEIPIVIVGAGPVGLGLALDLGWRGVPCLVLEQGDGAIDHPRMGLMNARTMEFCRRWGIVELFHKGGFPEDYGQNMTFVTSVFGHVLAREEYPCMRDMKPPPVSPERQQRGSQLWFDPTLARATRAYTHVRLLYHCQFLRFEERANDVIVHAVDKTTNETVTIRARYLVGCDGAGSGVRKALGIGLDGNPALSQSVGIFFRSPELYKLHDKGDTQRFILLDRKGTWATLTAIDGRSLWRLTMLGKDGPAQEGLDVDETLQRMAGGAFPYEVLSVLPWRRSKLVAQSYGHGRVFIAGDAAHTMSPTGGFGMNTGMGDAIDLSWKLSAALEGWAGSALLASYDAERRPVGLRNVNAASENFGRTISATKCDSILDETEEGARTRREVGAQIKGAMRQEWESLGIELGYRYENSPICIADGTPPPPDDPMIYTPSARPGSRAPHAWLEDGRSLLDLFGRGFVLLRFGGATPDTARIADAAAQRALPLRIVDIAERGIADLYERRFVLVRPDGHVAWRGDALPNDSVALIDRVRGARDPQA